MIRVGGRFRWVEPRCRARAFVLGLLSELPRKNCRTIAGYAGDPSPDGLPLRHSPPCWTDGRLAVPSRPSRPTMIRRPASGHDSVPDLPDMRACASAIVARTPATPLQMPRYGKRAHWPYDRVGEA